MPSATFIGFAAILMWSLLSRLTAASGPPLIPTGRLGEPDEIARCVVFLASDDAGFITALDAVRQWPAVFDLSTVATPIVAVRHTIYH